MFNLPVFVGLDYHQNVIQVCVMDQNRKILFNQAVGNDPDEVMRVVAPFGGNVHAAIEASTGVADFAEKLITLSHWCVELAHPGYVARMKQTPDKSDWTDAKLLADLTRAGYIPRVWLAPKFIRNLRELVRHRHGLIEQRKQVKLRLRALLRNHRIVCPFSPWAIKGKAWLLDETNIPSQHVLFLLGDHFDTIEYFDKKVGHVTEKMQADIVDDPVVKQLLQQPGVGMITAITMRALIGRFDRFRSGKQLSHFCAVCPRNNSSAGKTTTGGLIKAGDELLRIVVIEAAHRLIRYDPHWRDMATRLRANGKKPCVIVGAVANRWVRKLFHQMQNPEPFDATTVGFLRHGQESTVGLKNPSDAGTKRRTTPESSAPEILARGVLPRIRYPSVGCPPAEPTSVSRNKKT
jgi:transposase